MLCAFIIGLNKSGLKGISTLTIPILAKAYGGMTSVAILLPFLIFGDSIALCFYKKKHTIQIRTTTTSLGINRIINRYIHWQVYQ
jgi:hypothetical protein